MDGAQNSPEQIEASVQNLVDRSAAIGMALRLVWGSNLSALTGLSEAEFDALSLEEKRLIMQKFGL